MSGLEDVFVRLRDLVGSNHHFAIAGHVGADGDCLGAMSAFAHFLTGEGKIVDVYLHEPIPDRYGFLNIEGFSKVYDDSEHRESVKEADIFIAFDLSDPRRLGDLRWAMDIEAGLFRVIVDHHLQADARAADLFVCDTDAAATALIVSRFFEFVGRDPTLDIALSLATGIVSDTGWFRYSSTSQEVFEMAVQLMQCGVDFPGLYRNIYQANPLALVRLTGHIASSFSLESGGLLAWAVIPFELSKSLALPTEFETDGILDVMRSVAGVDTVALFREAKPGLVRVNLRSQNAVDVNEVSRSFDGGGHRHAAGLTYRGNLEGDVHDIVRALKDRLSAVAPDMT